jgi:hypothetical protein
VGHGEIYPFARFRKTFPAKLVPAYTTIQITLYQLEVKEIVRRVKKVGNFHIFVTSISRGTETADRCILQRQVARLNEALAYAEGVLNVCKFYQVLY